MTRLQLARKRLYCTLKNTGLNRWQRERIAHAAHDLVREGVRASLLEALGTRGARYLCARSLR